MMTSFSKKSPAEKQRLAMQKKAILALNEQEQVAQTRAEKTAQLRAVRLARQIATEELAEDPGAKADGKRLRLPKAHRPQM